MLTMVVPSRCKIRTNQQDYKDGVIEVSMMARTKIDCGMQTCRTSELYKAPPQGDKGGKMSSKKKSGKGC